jgi:hypothetical protein
MAGERDGLLGGGAAAAAARHQGNRANGEGPLDPFVDPHEAERWPLDPDGVHAATYPEEYDLGNGYGASRPESGVEVAVGAAGRPPVGVGGWGGRSVGPHNYDIPGRYGPGGVMRGRNSRQMRASEGGSGDNGLSPAMREVRRAWGWDSSGRS